MAMDQLCTLVAALGFGLCSAETATPWFADVSAEALAAKSGSPNSMAAQASDLDGDGDLDLAIAVENGTNRVLLNDGTGYLTEARLTGPSGDHEDVAIADYDRDGDLDLVFIGEDDQMQGYHLNDGKAGFTDVTERLPGRTTSNTVVTADLDCDGDADLVTANAGPDFVWINDGTGHFTDESAARLPQHPDISQDIAVGDIDNDGDPDLAFGNEEQNRLYRNDGTGHFTEAPLPRRATPEETRDVDLVDVDGDGDLDLYFANVRIFNADRDQQDRLLFNDGTGAFTDATTNLVPDDELTTSSAFVDLDHDGDLDLIRGSMGDRRAERADAPLLAFRNDGAGHFEAAPGILPAITTANAFDIEPADFNSDGLLDLFVASRGGSDRLVLGLK